MPNWCTTRITINHDDENKLKEFEKLINEWTSKNYMENGFGLQWLGNIVGNSGIGTIDKNLETDLRCRGSITWIECDDYQLLIDTETAWVPMLKMWVKLLEKYLPDAELIYSAEECGMGIYSTNDPCLKDCYIMDCYDMEDIESDWEASEETVRKILQELLKTDETDVEKLIELLNDSEYGDKMIVHKWEYDDISVWE